MIRNESVDVLANELADDCKEMIKLSYDRNSAFGQKDFSKKSYPTTKQLQMSFNELVVEHSYPAVVLCQVNELNSRNKELTQFEILQLTMPFIEMMPQIAQKNDTKFRSISICSKRQMFSKKLTIAQELQALKQKSGESRVFDKKVIDQLQAKIFSPHLISNNTVLNFQAFVDDGHLVSLIDIFRVFYQDNKQHAKYFFKFDPEEYEEHNNQDRIQEIPVMQRSRSVINHENRPNDKEIECTGQKKIRRKETEYF